MFCREDAVILEKDNALNSCLISQLLCVGRSNVRPTKILIGAAVKITDIEKSMVETGKRLVHSGD
jgi:hypothetical protein